MHQLGRFLSPDQKDIQNDVSRGNQKCTLAHPASCLFSGNVMIPWEHVSRGVLGPVCFMFSTSINPITGTEDMGNKHKGIKLTERRRRISTRPAHTSRLHQLLQKEPRQGGGLL